MKGEKWNVHGLAKGLRNSWGAGMDCWLWAVPKDTETWQGDNTRLCCRFIVQTQKRATWSNLSRTRWARAEGRGDTSDSGSPILTLAEAGRPAGLQCILPKVGGSWISPRGKEMFVPASPSSLGRLVLPCPVLPPPAFPHHHHQKKVLPWLNLANTGAAYFLPSLAHLGQCCSLCWPGEPCTAADVATEAACVGPGCLLDGTLKYILAFWPLPNVGSVCLFSQGNSWKMDYINQWQIICAWSCEMFWLPSCSIAVH